MANPILVVPTATNHTGFTSILGDKSGLYRNKTQEGGGILDVPEEGTVEFYCAGYTKPDPNTNVNRQEWHRRLYAEALRRNKENSLYPLPHQEYTVQLIHDPSNKFDVNKAALRIVLHPKSDTLKKCLSLDKGNPVEIELGFVPARINVDILKNLHLVNSAQILKVRMGYHEKYCTTKIILAYGHNRMGSKGLPLNNRFIGILDEV
jgi:hypothetical protein